MRKIKIPTDSSILSIALRHLIVPLNPAEEPVPEIDSETFLEAESNEESEEFVDQLVKMDNESMLTYD
ncbi:hypothetical protein K3495_g1768 [Podosphaera aphanis]|nr:hypothetical protein K3495_g1768 [Podosphaera aphanis]